MAGGGCSEGLAGASGGASAVKAKGLPGSSVPFSSTPSEKLPVHAKCKRKRKSHISAMQKHGSVWVTDGKGGVFCQKGVPSSARPRFARV